MCYQIVICRGKGYVRACVFQIDFFLVRRNTTSLMKEKYKGIKLLLLNERQSKMASYSSKCQFPIVQEQDFSKISSSIFFQSFALANKPVKLTNVLSKSEIDSARHEHFDRKRFNKKFGDRTVQVAPQQPGKPDKWLINDSASHDKCLTVACQREQMKLSEFLSTGDTTYSTCYADGANCLEKDFAFIKHIFDDKQLLNLSTRTHDLLPALDLKNSDVWIGTGLTKSRLHYDNQDNLFCQIVGSKKVILISPKSTKALATEPLVKKYFTRERQVVSADGTYNYKYSPMTDGASDSEIVQNYATWDWNQPENDENAKVFSEFEIFECRLDAGDLLYIPFGWWHEIQGILDDGSGRKVDFDTFSAGRQNPCTTKSPESSNTATNPNVENLSNTASLNVSYTAFFYPVYCRMKGKFPIIRNPRYKASIWDKISSRTSAKDELEAPVPNDINEETVSEIIQAAKDSLNDGTVEVDGSGGSGEDDSKTKRNVVSSAAKDSKSENSAEKRILEATEKVLDEWFVTGITRWGLQKFIKEKIADAENTKVARVRKWLLLRMNAKMWQHKIERMVVCPENIPDLRSYPVWTSKTSEKFAFLTELENAYEGIRDEVVSLRGDCEFQPYRDAAPETSGDTSESSYSSSTSENKRHRKTRVEPGVEATTSGNWNVLYLHLNHKKFDVLDKLPKTKHAIEKIFPRHYSHAFFSALCPGTDIIPHFGPSNRMLRCWLPISGCGKSKKKSQNDQDVDSEDIEVHTISTDDQDSTKKEDFPVALQVADKVVIPKNGEVFVWDHSYRHSAWNFSKSTRLVLIVDIWHPDLTAEEVQFLSAMTNAKLRMGRRLLEQAEAERAELQKTDAFDPEIHNNLFSIVEKTKGLLTSDDWWVLEAERSGD